MTTVWSAGASLSLNTIVAPTADKRLAGMFFKVTSAGTTGSSEPSWPEQLVLLFMIIMFSMFLSVLYLAIYNQ